MEQLSLGVMARSRKENEQRLPIHPLHIERIEADLRRRLYLECGYGERFGVPDEQLAGLVGGVRTRDQLLADCDVLLLPKPLPQDLEELAEGQVLWGWPHCVSSIRTTNWPATARFCTPCS
jgi:alanine dehydrogenase